MAPRPICELRKGSPRHLACPRWEQAIPVGIACFHPEGSDHRPRTTCRALYDRTAIHLRFDVRDRYVKSVHRNFQDPVCRDSCVEFFVQPSPTDGYCNFEVNAGGTLHVAYIEDPTRSPAGVFASGRLLTQAEVADVTIAGSLPPIVEPEIIEPVSWQLAISIPFTMLAMVTGAPCQPDPETPWRGNFYKLGSGTSHPHWASWAPIGTELNFHCPEYFGELHFAPQ